MRAAIVLAAIMLAASVLAAIVLALESHLQRPRQAVELALHRERQARERQSCWR